MSFLRIYFPFRKSFVYSILFSMKRISLLGSTGSIGKSALEVIDHLGGDFQVAALSARENIETLYEQALKYRPQLIAVYEEAKAQELEERLPEFRVVAGMEGLQEAATLGDMTLSAMSGTLGLIPTLAAIRAKKDIALANKETLVSGGALVMQEVRAHQVELLPVDSEHSALFQCLIGENPLEVERLILTASGGPFRNHTWEELAKIQVSDALNHPTWRMGPKVTIDSSTLMNKGLEMIEAAYLFDLTPAKIDIVIHPQSIIHSLVEFQDGSMKAQMSVPDMKLPIQYAFTFPKRRGGLLKPFDFIRHGKLEFYQADKTRFRCLELAYSALKEGLSFPGYMNAANEVLVGRFLKGQVTWIDIAAKLEKLMERHIPYSVDSLDKILEVDQLARREAAEI